MATSQNPAPTRQLPPICDSCQYCQDCDPNPGQPTQRLRFCNRGLGRIVVQSSSHYDCPATAPLRGSTVSAPHSRVPPTTPTARLPSDQSTQRQRRQDGKSLRGVEYIDILTNDDARAQYGNNYNNYGELPPQAVQHAQVEGPVRYERLTSSGKARVLAGNNYNNYTYGYKPPTNEYAPPTNGCAPLTDKEPEIAPHLY
jgi:hypothetical protein